MALNCSPENNSLNLLKQTYTYIQIVRKNLDKTVTFREIDFSQPISWQTRGESEKGLSVYISKEAFRLFSLSTLEKMTNI